MMMHYLKALKEKREREIEDEVSKDIEKMHQQTEWEEWKEADDMRRYRESQSDNNRPY